MYIYSPKNLNMENQEMERNVRAVIYHTLAMDELVKGRPESFMRNMVDVFKEKEEYEACEGIEQAIIDYNNFKNKD